MRYIILIFILSNVICLSGQIDSILKLNILTNDKEKNNVIINKLNNKLTKYDIDVKYYRNISGDIYINKYVISEEKCDDSSCIYRTVNEYILKNITNRNVVIKSYYIDSLGEKLSLINNQNELSNMIKEFETIYDTRLDTSKLFTDDSGYITNVGEGWGELSLEMRKVISSIKNKKYKNLLSYLKSPLPEDKLYGLLGVEIINQKKQKIPIDILKYYEISKNTKGKAYNCEGDMCSLNDFQELFKQIPKLASTIIQMHHL